MRFYLGTHEPTWLNRSHVALFVSAVRLRDRCKRKLPRARAPWALDSGGFSVLSKHGGYPTTNREYAAEVRRWHDEIGMLEWAAVQDWMCEPVMIERTGLSVAEHQRRTVASYAELRFDVGVGLPWVPVLQGYTHADYLRCLDLYDAAGFNLRELPLVGIGSVCRRQSTADAEVIIRDLTARGLRLHGFGFKMGGLTRCRDVLASADSLAWSDGARKVSYRERAAILAAAEAPSLFDVGPAPAAVRSPQNSPAVAVEWLHGVRVRAAITPEPGLLVCPFCDSLDVCPPLSSVDYCCVECGESWADIREPALV